MTEDPELEDTKDYVYVVWSHGDSYSLFGSGKTFIGIYDGEASARWAIKPGQFFTKEEVK